MKKIVFLSLLILAACSYEPEVKPSPPYGANGSACGTYYTNWTWRDTGGWSGSPFDAGRTKYFSNYFKPASAGSTFWWPLDFSAIIRVTNYGRGKIRATYGDWSQDIAVGGYADFYYSWTPPGGLGCFSHIPDTSLPIAMSFYRVTCGSTSGSPYNGQYYIAANVQVISATGNNNFNGLQAFFGTPSSTCTN